jgi:hypothetical protein
MTLHPDSVKLQLLIIQLLAPSSIFYDDRSPTFGGVGMDPNNSHRLVCISMQRLRDYF